MNPETGLISVAEAIEEANALITHHTLEVSVTDGKFSDKAVVNVEVEKSDNSGLAFSKERYMARVLENTTKTDVIVVVDVLGAALNENLEFSLLNPTDMFAIGHTSGAIRTTGKRFDREAQGRHELVVEVKSGEEGRGGLRGRSRPRVARAVVEVDVLDINDNSPSFVNRPYHAVMSKEVERDATVIQVTAVDADEGTNGDIYYQLVKGNGELFRVGRKSGRVTLRQTQESYKKEYRLTVAAYDGGTPPFSAETTVVIRVIDKSVPVFSRQFYKASVREDVEPFTPVVRCVHAVWFIRETL